MFKLFPRLVFTALLMGTFCFSGFAQDCKSSDEYDRQNFRVRQVRISAPLSWLLGSVDQEIQDLLSSPDMPVKAGDLFNSTRASQGYVWLRRRFPELSTSGVSRVAVRFGGNTIAACDDSTKQLDVVYKLYVFRPSYYYGRTFELSGETELNRSTVNTDSTKKLTKYLLQPYVGYNDSHKALAGTNLTVTLPNSFINKIIVDGSGSSNSSEMAVAAVGRDDYNNGFIRHSEWSVAYLYSNLPSTRTKLKQGGGSAQFYLSSRALGSNELMLRFGGAIDGGNRQSRLDSNIPPFDLANSSVINVKGFAGATMKIGTQSVKASYGLQLGNATEGLKLDFVKQVFDSAVDLNVTRLQNLSIAASFTAGKISQRGNVPVVEKFFGGNGETEFILGNAWQIRANPFIRSFPQNELSQVRGSGIVGLDSFLSFDLTVSVPVWRRALVPRDVWEDPNNPGELEPRLSRALETQFTAAELQISNGYLSEGPEYRAVVAPILQMVAPVAALKCLLLGPAGAGSDCHAPGIPTTEPVIRNQLELLFIPPEGDAPSGSGKFDVVETSLMNVIEAEKKEASDANTIRVMVVDDDPDPDDPTDESWRSQINALSQSLLVLEGALPGGISSDIRTLRVSLEGLASTARRALDVLDNSAQAVEAKEKAKRDMLYPRRVLTYLIREANLYALSPVFIFDAARISQRSVPASEWRTGIGTGLKFSFIGLSLTGGYVWNPNRRFEEPRGAAIFKIEVIDIFK